MNIKGFLSGIEKPLLYGYILLWLTVYLCSRFFLVMYTDHGMPVFWPWIALAIFPFCLYAAYRTVAEKSEKWYGVFGYTIIYTLLGLFATAYIIVNGDMLLSVVFKPSEQYQVRLTDVHKVFSRKTGFDHTSVTFVLNGEELTMEARPFAFFYLHGKPSIKLRYGKSALGNTYVTSVEMSSAAKLKARWLHFTDMLYRMRLLWGLLALFVLAIFIGGKYFPDRKLKRNKPLSFWKQFGIVMGILVGLALLFYAGVWVYYLVH